MSDHLINLLESIGAPRILVVGDLILDRYVWGDVSRISPEGPIPILHVNSREERPGGAGNVASNLSHLRATVSVCGVVGSDVYGAALCAQLVAQAVDTRGVVACEGRTTAVKTRYVGAVQSARRGLQHMLRVDEEVTDAVSKKVEDRLLDHVAKVMGEHQVVVLSDYNKGLLTERIIRRVIELARERCVPVVTDPKIGRSYALYAGSTVLTPNRYETRMATGIAPVDDKSIRAAARTLIEMADLSHAVITLDRDGMFVAGREGAGMHIPVRPREVYDVTGAGDMVVSVIALVLASGGTMGDAAALANVAAGIEVAKVGAAPVSRDEIVADMLGAEGVARKMVTAEEAAEMASEARRRNRKVVWTNGCFDILHVGHYEYLRFSHRQGDLLIVGLNSDASVRRVKGANRPITHEAERAKILAALDMVDAVVVFDEDTPLRMIKMVKPDVLVKGADYTKEEVVGWDVVESYGGRVALAPIVEGASTSSIVQRIVELHGNASDEGKGENP